MSVKLERLNERIRAVLSDLLLREIADPGLKGVTVTDVKLDAEVMFANVYVNALGDETRREEVLIALERAGGFLRRQVGKRIRSRNTPQLLFHWDTTLEHGERISQLLENLDIPPEDEEVFDDD